MNKQLAFFGFIVVCFIPIVVFQRHIMMILSKLGYNDGELTSIVDRAFTLPSVMTTTSSSSEHAAAVESTAAIERNSGSIPDLTSSKVPMKENNYLSRSDEASNLQSDSHKNEMCQDHQDQHDLPSFDSLFDVGSKVEDGDNNSTNKRSTAPNNYVDGLPRFQRNMDASRALQFAVLGFPKAGTTAMRKALSNIALMAPGDYCPNRPEEIVHDMYFNKDIWKRAIERSAVSRSIPQLASMLERGNGTIVHSSEPISIDTPVMSGVKCPRGLDTLGTLRYYTTSFPKTKLLVGIRHPVTWFESFYNFRVQNFGQREDAHALAKSCVPMDDGRGGKENTTASATNTTAVTRRRGGFRPSYLSITGNPRKCRSQSCPNDQLLCVDRSRFHLFLSQLGKIPQDFQSRIDYDNGNHYIREFPYLPSNRYMYETFRSKNPIFVYTMEQMSTSFTWNVSTINVSETSPDAGTKRVEQFWTDISNFVNAVEDEDGCGENNKHDKLMIPTKKDGQNDETNATTSSSYHVKPGKKLTDQQQQARNQYKIDICDDTYNDIREQLMHYGWQMSHYICDHFIPHGDQVYASDVDYLCNTILKSYYQNDPCNKLRLVDADRGTYAIA